ncbi:MAG: response regulator [Muribaculaceae bacterium]|nr:response regulator [Muribaculaceae bacterium]
MLKVLLVDDEPNVRQGVKMMIPWEDLGLTVIGEGEDGDDGLAKIISLNPDIVVADVKMPGMTGIEMLEEAFKRGYGGKCLILSGYSDFTYAKSAMSLGVKQFILKPVDEDELIASLKDLAKEIEGERINEVTMQKGSEYMNEQLLRGLLLGEETVPEGSVMSGYGYSCYNAVIVSTSEKMSAEEKNYLLGSVKKKLEKDGGADVITPEFSGMTVALFKGWEKDRLVKFLTELNDEYVGKMFITVGCTVDKLTDINRSYAEADGLLRDRFRYFHRGVVTADTAEADSGNADETAELIDNIYAYIEINDIDRLSAVLERFQMSMCSGAYSAERIKVNCITAVMEIKSRLIKSVGEKKTEQYLNDEFIARIGEKASLFDIIELMKKTFTDLSHTYFGRTTKSTMERVVRYIQSNYGTELRLEQLAAIFGYNRAYLGKVFHQYTGENFNNYLDRIRITEAKRLLAANEHKVYEVAEMVGYTNINYFHNKFKKYVGISPLNYKRQCSGESAAGDEGEED